MVRGVGDVVGAGVVGGDVVGVVGVVGGVVGVVGVGEVGGGVGGGVALVTSLK